MGMLSMEPRRPPRCKRGPGINTSRLVPLGARSSAEEACPRERQTPRPWLGPFPIHMRPPSRRTWCSLERTQDRMM